LAVVFLAAAGKPYYLAGLYPVLLAAGAPVFLGWLRDSSRGNKIVTIGGIIGLSAVANAVLMLPVLGVDIVGRTPVVAVNYDAGETIGWPQFAAQIAAVANALSAGERSSMVLLTGNYGEAGALDRFGPELGLPQPYSGHNAYHAWGPPPESVGADVIVAVGIAQERLSQFCGSLERARTIDNGVDVDNDEQGRTVWLCRDRSKPWTEIWPALRTLG
jgi:hypothetical protein